MLLFLDVISPIPEFFIIEENKIILQRKIIKNETEKLSDNIFEIYENINKELSLQKNLTKLAMTIGPGSYTSLRVGASFIAGLKYSQKLSFCPISINDLIKFKEKKVIMKEFGYFICSANKQQFLCTIDKYNKLKYTKVTDKELKLPKNIKKIFYNIKKLNLNLDYINQYKFTFINELIVNSNKLIFEKNNIINPIYISDNKILN